MHGRCGPHMCKDAIVRDLQKNETDINHGVSRELLDVVNIVVRIELERVICIIRSARLIFVYPAEFAGTDAHHKIKSNATCMPSTISTPSI